MAAKILQFPQRMTPERQARVDAAPSLHDWRVQRLVDRLEEMAANPKNVHERRFARSLERKVEVRYGKA